MTFYDALLAHGLLPRNPPVPGDKWRRCPTRSHPRKLNGAFRLTADGLVGFYRDYAVDQGTLTWRPDRVSDAPAFDPARLREARREQQRKQAAATQAAREYYAKCRPLIGGHPYLEAHGLDMTGAFNLRVDDAGWLVVPAYVNGKISTIQRIAPDGSKLFWPGASVKGASYTIDRPMSSITVLCEGLATGMAIFAASPQSRIVVGFNAGNLLPAAELVGMRGLCVIAADNDHRTVCQWHKENAPDEGRRIAQEPQSPRPEGCKCNPGVLAALSAGAALGIGVCWPRHIEGTDYADMRQENYAARVAVKKPKERESDIRRVVDAALGLEIMRHARFIAPKEVA